MSEQQFLDSEVAMVSQVLEQVAELVLIEPTNFEPLHDQAPARSSTLVAGGISLRAFGQIWCI